MAVRIHFLGHCLRGGAEVLVLSRKLNECVVVSDNQNEVCIKVVRISSGRVQLAIDAPIDVGVRRGELLEAESKQAACNLVNSSGYLNAP